MSLDPQSPSNNTNALDFTQPSKKDYNTIEFTNKENRQINEMVTLSLDTIQVSNVADRGVKAKPVDETYNCRNNKSKFCLPLGINSARTLEADIKKKKKEQNDHLKSTSAQPKKRQAVQLQSGKEWHNQLVACSKKRFPNDSRNALKFVEAASKL